MTQPRTQSIPRTHGGKVVKPPPKPVRYSLTEFHSATILGIFMQRKNRAIEDSCLGRNDPLSYDRSYAQPAEQPNEKHKPKASKLGESYSLLLAMHKNRVSMVAR